MSAEGDLKKIVLILVKKKFKKFVFLSVQKCNKGKGVNEIV